MLRFTVQVLHYMGAVLPCQCRQTAVFQSCLTVGQCLDFCPSGQTADPYCSAGIALHASGVALPLLADVNGWSLSVSWVWVLGVRVLCGQTAV